MNGDSALLNRELPIRWTRPGYGRRRVPFIFVERARVNVRVKGRWVNSVFLVQLRKMLATDWR
jgi:hypothetical protein